MNALRLHVYTISMHTLIALHRLSQFKKHTISCAVHQIEFLSSFELCWKRAIKSGVA
jgi:hypothetical protein